MNHHHHDLIDTTEMYLRTVYELEEEGVTPLRARIAERLGQSGPTVSQTVGRMERDGLVVVAGDRHLELTEQGRREAISVMRKHRLAERLLADVIGLDWEDVHIEACRWEHVMSDAVERRILALLDKPLLCPHGNPIPGLDQLGLPFATGSGDVALATLSDAANGKPADVVIARISEMLQPDAELMHQLSDLGLRPGGRILATAAGDSVEIVCGRLTTTLPRSVTDHVFVRPADVGPVPDAALASATPAARADTASMSDAGAGADGDAGEVLLAAATVTTAGSARS